MCYIKQLDIKFLVAIGIWVLLVTSTSKAATSDPDPNSSPEWKAIKLMMFGERKINPDGNGIVRLFLNTKADDASTVPVMVNGLIDQTSEKYIKTLYLIVEGNPSPIAGVFHFSPRSGRMKVETRLRFEQFSFVRAVAETNDGELYISQRYVHASGGCSSPGGKNKLSESLLGKIRFRIDDVVEFNRPVLVQMQVRHPNESSLAADFDVNRVPQFVRNVSVTYNENMVMTAQVDFSLSDNPLFVFYFVPEEEGELKVRVEDTHDKVFERSVFIGEGVVASGS